MTKPRATASEQGWAHDGPWPEDNHWRVVYLETAIAITWTEADAVAIVQALKDRADQQAALTEAERDRLWDACLAAGHDAFSRVCPNRNDDPCPICTEMIKQHPVFLARGGQEA